jgi:hypothetical protein
MKKYIALLIYLFSFYLLISFFTSDVFWIKSNIGILFFWFIFIVGVDIIFDFKNKVF